MKEVAVNIRMSDDTKVLWKELAKNDNRSMSGYIELLLFNERDRVKNEQFTLKDVIDTMKNGFVCILEKMDSIPKARKASKPKSSPMDCELPKDLSEESWNDWITHLHRCDVHLNQYRAQKHADKFAQYSEDYDVNMLVERLIDDGAMSVFIPNDWKKKETKRSWA